MTDEKDNLSFLDDPPRDEHGRFAPRSEPAPADQPPPPPPTPQGPPPAAQPEPAPAAQPTPEPHPEPWKEAKWWDEREKRQRLERELEERDRKIAELTQRPQERVDPIIDPEGWERQQQAFLKQREWDITTKMTRTFAVRQYGADAVAAAEAWVKQEYPLDSPKAAIFAEVLTAQDDPYDFLVNEHKRSLSRSKLGDKDPDDYAREWALANWETLAQLRQGGAPPAGSPSPQPPARPPLPRPSIASAPAAAAVPKANVMQDEADVFSEVFSRKR